MSITLDTVVRHIEFEQQMDTAAVAAYLGVDEVVVKHLVADAGLPVHRYGCDADRLRFLPSEVDEWGKRLRSGGADDPTPAA